MAQIAWTDEARRWLQEIFDYIAENNEEAAYRYREVPCIRVLLYGHYRIAYLTSRAGNIEVLGVFHGALDLARYLSPRE